MINTTLPIYASFYGLELSPFENNPDPIFLFPAKSHREVLSSLRYGVDNSKGFMLITGPIGSGKTTMISAFLKNKKSSHIVFKIINPRCRFSEIVNSLAKKFGIDTAANSGLQIFEILQKKMAILDSHGKKVVLIIDEAHLLPEPTLENIRLLSNLERSNKKLIQIVLVGQDEIYQTLQKKSFKTLKQRILINRRIEPLNKQETFDYIIHRLRIAGRSSTLFSKNALTKIWHRSQGIPRIINSICDSALLIGFASEDRIIKRRVISEVITDMDTGFVPRQKRPFFQFKRFRFPLAKAGIVLFTLIALTTGVYFHTRFTTSSPSAYSNKNAHFQEKNKRSNMASNAGHNPKQSPSAPIYHQMSAGHTISGDLLKSLKNIPIPVNKTVTSPAREKPADSNRPNEYATEAPSASHKENKPPAESTLTKVVIKAKDTLYSIAKEYYGISNSTIVDRIHMVNPDIAHVDHIYAGQSIILPEIGKANLIHVDDRGAYQIHYASFYHPEPATICLAELSPNSSTCRVNQSYQNQNKVFRVYCGRYVSRDEALSELERFDLKYFASLI